MITDEDPLRGLLFYQDLSFSHTLHVLKERTRRCEYPHLRGRAVEWMGLGERGCLGWDWHRGRRSAAPHRATLQAIFSFKLSPHLLQTGTPASDRLQPSRRPLPSPGRCPKFSSEDEISKVDFVQHLDFLSCKHSFWGIWQGKSTFFQGTIWATFSGVVGSEVPICFWRVAVDGLLRGMAALLRSGLMALLMVLLASVFPSPDPRRG